MVSFLALVVAAFSLALLLFVFGVIFVAGASSDVGNSSIFTAVENFFAAFLTVFFFVRTVFSVSVLSKDEIGSSLLLVKLFPFISFSSFNRAPSFSNAPFSTFIRTASFSDFN